MAQVQNGVNLFHFAQDHPGLAALAASSFASPFIGLWSYNGAPVPGYGRLLTSHEAHAMPDHGSVESPPSPNVLPLDVFGHPNTVMYSPAPPALASSPQLPIDTPAVQSFDGTGNFTKPGHAMKTFDNVDWLVGALGVVGLVACVTAGLQAYKKKHKKSMDNDALVAFLQDEVNKIRKENSELKKECDAAKSAKVEVEVSRALLSDSREETKEHRVALKKCQDDFRKCQDDLKKCQYDLDDHKVQIVEIQRTNKSIKNSLDSEKVLHDGAKQDLEFHQTQLEQKTEEASRTKVKLEKLQEQHALLLQRFNSLESELETATTKKDTLSAELASQEDTIAEKDRVISSLQGKQQELQRASDDTASVLTTTKTEYEALKLQHAAQTQELETIRKSLQEKDAMVSELQDEEVEFQKNLEDMRDLVDERTADVLYLDRLVATREAKIREHEERLSYWQAASSDLREKKKSLAAKVADLTSKMRTTVTAKRNLKEKVDFSKDELERIDLKLKAKISELEGKDTELEGDLEDTAEISSDIDVNMTVPHQQHEENTKDLKQKHATHTADTNSKSKTNMAPRFQKHEKLIEELSKAYEAQAAGVKSEKDAELAALDQQHEKAIENLKRKHVTDTAESRSQIDAKIAELSRQHGKDIDDLKQTQDDDLAALRQQHDKEKAGLVASHSQATTQKDDDTARLASEVADLKTKLQEKEDELQHKQDKVQLELKDVTSAKAAMEMEHGAAMQKKDRESAEQLSNATEKFEQAQKKLDKANFTISEMKTQYDAKIQVKSRESEGRRPEIDALRTELRDMDKTRAHLDSELKDSQEDVQQLQANLQQRTSDIEELRATNVAAANHEQDVQNLQAKLREAEDQLRADRDKSQREMDELLSQHKAALDLKDEEIAAKVQSIDEVNRQAQTSLQTKINTSKSELAKLNLEVCFERQGRQTANDKLETAQNQFDELQTQHDSMISDKNQEIASHALTIQKEREKTKVLQEQLRETTNSHQISMAEMQDKLEKSRDELAERQKQHVVILAQIDREVASHVSAIEDERQKNTTLHEQSQEASKSHQVSLTEVQSKLKNLQDELDEQQKQHDSILAQKDEKFASQSRQKTQHLEELLQAKTKEVEDSREELTEIKAYLLDDDARAKTFKELVFSNRKLREALRWTLYKGIVDRGVLPPTQIIRLKLPHADPYYSDLPQLFPKPCDELNELAEDDKTTCDACGETYEKGDYHNHGPACLMYFPSYAIRCKGCNGVFHWNQGFQKHEKYCKKHMMKGPAPDVREQLPYTSENGVLAGDLSIPSESAIQYILTKKAKVLGEKVEVLGNKADDTLYRAVPPYKDPDYDTCKLPLPMELDSILPKFWPANYPSKDTYGGRKKCRMCKEWYHTSDFHAHFEACKAFFHGDGTSLGHGQCSHCGDIFRKNDVFNTHVSLCQKNPTAGVCDFCGDVFKLEVIEFTDKSLSEDILSEHMRVCHLNPRREKIPVPEKDEKPEKGKKDGKATPTTPSKATATEMTTTGTSARVPSPKAHPDPVRTPNPPAIATNGYQQPQPQSRSPSSLLSPFPSPLPPSPTSLSATAPAFNSPTPGTTGEPLVVKSPSFLSKLSKQTIGRFKNRDEPAGTASSRPSSQPGSPSPPQQQADGLSGSQHASPAASPSHPPQQSPGVSSSRHASQAGSPPRPQQQPIPVRTPSTPSTPTPSPKKYNYGAS